MFIVHSFIYELQSTYKLFTLRIFYFTRNSFSRTNFIIYIRTSIIVSTSKPNILRVHEILRIKSCVIRNYVTKCKYIVKQKYYPTRFVS